MPRRVRTAVLLAILCHGLFILTARYRLSYDAYTHMLFANHYAQDWFSLWETRWYTGFTVVSYPPLTHQLIALFIPFLGFDKAFAFILWIVTSLYPLGIHAFSRSFTGKTSSSYAALASAMLLPIYVTAHIFGQLPFLTSTLTALFAAAGLHRFLREGGVHNFALSVALSATSMAMHHATLMVQPFFILAVIFSNNFLDNKHSGQLRWLLFKRLFLFCVLSAITSIAVIFPFWQWGTSQTLQMPIDHLSRHNFLTDPLALAIFFLPLYGPFIVVIPFLFRKWNARFIGLLISFAVLFLLGLGGTTPLPRLLFGDAWEWLTYDRFAFWACLTLTPFFGILFIQLKRRWMSHFIRKPLPVAIRRGLLSVLVFSFFAITALGAWFTPLVFPVQPEPIQMQPIVDFLNDGNNSQWRYLTFGFGDQFAYLNLRTQATTLDGSYHTARTLPELRESGVGQVDTSYWALNGIALIKPILQKSGEHSVRWGFVNPKTLEAVQIRWGTVHRSPFIPLLDELGWKKLDTLENGILVYENPNVTPLAKTQTPIFPPFISFSWGVLPMLAFVATSALGMLRIYPYQTEWVLRKVYTFLIVLLPITLCFWIYRTIADFSHPRVYFTYDNALFFLSDAIVLTAIVLWLAVKISQASTKRMERSFFFPPYSFILLFFVFSLLLTLSTLWSRDGRTSLYISLHFWLVFLLILSLRDWPESWTFALYGFCAALSIELITGFAEFALQSTSFLNPLAMKWPGALESSLPGASVVQLGNGLRFLRAYGTLPHPNILGGFVLLTMLGPLTVFLSNKRPNYPALFLLSLALILLTLTFSRSAWLGMIAFVTVLILKSNYFEPKRLILLISTIVMTMVCTLYPLRQLIFTRVGNQGVATEQISTLGRSWLTQKAVSMIRTSPIMGVGIGSFILELANTTIPGAPIEPVHNMFLLITAELGVIGLFLFMAIFTSITLTIIQSKSPQKILAGAIITGLAVTSMFDHYLWTIAPGRLMLGLALGLWAGQVAHEA